MLLTMVNIEHNQRLEYLYMLITKATYEAANYCYISSRKRRFQDKMAASLPHQNISQSLSTTKYGLYQQEARHFTGMP